MAKAIMDYVPKTKLAAVRDAYKDEDGYWICLNDGWEASRTDRGCHTIHEDTIKELRYQIAGIQRIDKEPTEAPEKEMTTIVRNQLNGFDYWYDEDAENYVVFCNGDEARFDTIEDAWCFTKEIRLAEKEAEIMEWIAEEEAEADEAATEAPNAELDPDEYQEIQDSMTEAFYKFCTGEQVPENWKEIVRKERNRNLSSGEAVEIVLDSIVQDPEYFDTPIPPRHDPEPQPPAPKSGSGRGAAETVAFGLCMGLAYAVYGARELAVILFYALQAWLITLLTASRIGLKAACRLWVRIYPHIKRNSRRMAVYAVRMAKEAVIMMAVIAFMIRVVR